MAALVVVAMAACGDSETEADRVEAALVSLQRDMAAGRADAVCGALTRRSQRQIGSVGHGRKPTTCPRDLRDLVLGTEQAAATGAGRPLGKGRRPRVVDVSIAADGRRATATLELAGGRFLAPLVKRGDSWQLGDFFGAVAPAPRALR